MQFRQANNNNDNIKCSDIADLSPIETLFRIYQVTFTN